jgi:hypothetical protein
MPQQFHSISTHDNEVETTSATDALSLFRYGTKTLHLKKNAKFDKRITAAARQKLETDQLESILQDARKKPFETVVHMEIYDDLITSNTAEYIAELFALCPNLQSLVFSDISFVQQMHLFHDLFANKTDLREITFLRCTLDDEASKIFAEASAKSPQLRTLSICDTGITDSGLRFVMQQVLKSSIQTLSLTGCELKFLDIFDDSATNSSLQTLKLSYCRIDHRIAEKLAAAIAKLPDLKHLTLRNNPLQDQGIQAIARAIADHKLMLETLTFENCEIAATGAQALATAIQTIDLRELYLSFNQIGTSGAIAIVQAVLTLPNFSSLSMCNNNIGPSAKLQAALEILCSPVKVLQALYLSGNDLPVDLVQNLLSIAKSNHSLNSLNFGIMSHEIRPVLFDVLSAREHELEARTEDRSSHLVDPHGSDPVFCSLFFLYPKPAKASATRAKTFDSSALGLHSSSTTAPLPATVADSTVLTTYKMKLE